MASLLRWVASSCVALLALGCGGSDGQQPEGASGGSGGGTGSDPFTLLYRDDFDSFDQNRWQLMTHSWSSNLSFFS